MSSSRRTAITVLTLVITISGLWVLTADAQDAQPAATAQVLVVKRAGRAEPPPQFQEDYIAIQTVLVKSQVMAERAVQRGKLDELMKVDKADALNAVSSSLTVKRHLPDSNSANVLTLSIQNQPKPVALAMLNAIIESYQMYLDEIYVDHQKAKLDALDRTRIALATQIESSEREYDAFLKSVAEAGVVNDPDRLNERLSHIYKRLAQVDVNLTELDARIQHCQNQSEAKGTPAALQMRIHDWAAKSGLDKSQATVANFIAALKSERAELQLLKANLESIASQTIKDRSVIKSLERDELRLRSARDRAVSMNSKLEKLIEESNARGETGGYRLFVVSQPN